MNAADYKLPRLSISYQRRVMGFDDGLVAFHYLKSIIRDSDRVFFQGSDRLGWAHVYSLDQDFFDLILLHSLKEMHLAIGQSLYNVFEPLLSFFYFKYQMTPARYALNSPVVPLLS